MNNPLINEEEDSRMDQLNKSTFRMLDTTPLSARHNIIINNNNKNGAAHWRKMFRRNSEAFQEIRTQCQYNFQRQRSSKRNELLCEKRNAELNNIKLYEPVIDPQNNTTNGLDNNLKCNPRSSQSQHGAIPNDGENSAVASLAWYFKTIKLSTNEDELYHTLQQLISNGILDHENSFNDEAVLCDCEIVAFMAKVLDNINRNDIILNVLCVLHKLIVYCDIFTKYILCSTIPNKLIGLLHNSNLAIVELVVVVIGNLMMSNTEYRNMLITSETTLHVLTSINRNEATLDHIKQVLWICCSLCSSKQNPPELEIYKKLVSIISFALDYSVELAHYALLAVSYMVALGGVYLDIVIQRNCIVRAMQWLQSGEKQLEVEALHVMGELVAHDEKYVKYAIDIRLLDEICYRIDCDNFFVMESLFFIISNLADTNPIYIQLLINIGVIEALFEVMDKFLGQVPNLIGWMVCNFFAKAEPKQAKMFIHETCLAQISKLLTFDIVSVKICALNTIISILEVAKSLEVISEVDSLLEKSNLLKLIENCQHHPDNNVYLLSREIIENYCSWDSTEVAQYNALPLR